MRPKKSKGGAPKQNRNRLTTAARSGHVGSVLADEVSSAGTKVNAIVNRALAELAAKIGPAGIAERVSRSKAAHDLVLPPREPGKERKHGWLTAAEENQIAQIRRAAERDRVAAHLLAKLKDLKGGALTHEQQAAQREIQAAALATIEKCLAKLGLGIDHDDHDPAGDLFRFVNGGTASPPPELAAEKAAHSLANESAADPGPSAGLAAEVREDCSPLRTGGIPGDVTDREPQEGQQ